MAGAFPGPTLETPIARGHDRRVGEQACPPQHLFAIDHSLHGAGRDVADVRAVIHLHGGSTPAASDGYPEEWTLPGKSQTCHYPSLQHAATLFYHDHTMGINRLNTYAGMLGFCIFATRAKIPRPAEGSYDIPLLVCDRTLRTDGQLDYPVSMKPGEVWVPEVFGDAILANGKLLPLSRRRADPLSFPSHERLQWPLLPLLARQQGRLPPGCIGSGTPRAPVPVKRVVMAPAERADILIDFSAMAGQRAELISDSFRIMQFRVASSKAPRLCSCHAGALHDTPRLAESSAVKTRRLTLDERMDDVQRSMGMLLNNTPWHAPITEKPVLHSDRNMGARQPDRRLAPDPSASGAVSDSRPPPV